MTCELCDGATLRDPNTPSELAPCQINQENQNVSVVTPMQQHPYEQWQHAQAGGLPKALQVG